MKNLLTLSAFVSVIIITWSCSKSSSNYSVTNHTIGMTTARTWTGYSYGNAKGDTLEGSNHFSWAEYFYYTTTDTSFAIVALNGFAINVMGNVLVWRSTDSITKIVIFDTTYANSAKSFLAWNYGLDTIHFESHQIFGQNDTSLKYYETNHILHSPGM